MKIKHNQVKMPWQFWVVDKVNEVPFFLLGRSYFREYEAAVILESLSENVLDLASIREVLLLVDKSQGEGSKA